MNRTGLTRAHSFGKAEKRFWRSRNHPPSQTPKSHGRRLAQVPAKALGSNLGNLPEGHERSVRAVELTQLARKELEEAAPESYKIFLLAVSVGLRRKEIDLLEWSSFRWDNCLIRIQPTEWFHRKSEESLADLPVEPEVMELFR